MADEDAAPAGGRRIPQPGFAGDHGTADPALAGALAAYAADPERSLEVFRALQHARLLVPVVAVLGDGALGDPALEDEGTADMATALLTGRDGRLALLAFTGLEALEAWRPEARPVPVAAALAARSALQEGASALVVDVAGPMSYVVEGPLLDGLARGWTLAGSDAGPVWLEPAE
jgi:SseB protein N-terminal domain